MKRLPPTNRLTIALFVLLAPTLAMAKAHGPLTAEQRAIFHGTAEDPPPEKLDATRKDLEGRHYLSGDERNLHLFYEHVKDLGGGYMGVGSDQAYMFAGWQKPEFVWLSDYDPWIKWEHMAYHAIFEASPDIATFRGHFAKKNVKQTIKFLEEHFKDHPEQRKVTFVFANAAHKIARRLRRLKSWAKKHGVPNFVSDEAQYQFVRDLVMEGRVRPMRANLLDDEGLAGIAEASRRLGVPMRVMYPSNAEQYWPFSDQYKANIRAQNWDDKSIIVRTLGIEHWNDDYHYMVQPAQNFLRWLEADLIKGIKQVYPWKRPKGPEEIPFSLVSDDPERARPKKRKK